MLKFFLVQPVIQTQFGVRNDEHRIVVGADPAAAARNCFDELPTRLKEKGKRFPTMYRVWAARTPESFHENVGSLVLEEEFDEDSSSSYDAVADMFDTKFVEVRL